MSNSVEKVQQRLRKAVAALEAAQVPHAVIGGNAVAAWVARVDESAVRNTRDVDRLVRRSDFGRVVQALEAGFIHREVAALGRRGTLQIFLDGPEAKERDAVHVVFSGERVTEEDAATAPDVTDSEPIDFFRLISLEALVRMKLTAFHTKDQMHLHELVNTNLVDESWVERYPDTLAERLQHVLDHPE